LITDISLIVTAIGVLGAMFSLRQSYRERLRQFEANYVERYWKLLDELSLDALRTADPAEISPGDEKAIRSYFYLCEDELEMRANGYISDNTYNTWADGMIEQLDQPMFAKVWSRVNHEARSGTNFPFANLSNLLKQKGPGSRYDPLSMPFLIKIVRGLKGIDSV